MTESFVLDAFARLAVSKSAATMYDEGVTDNLVNACFASAFRAPTEVTFDEKLPVLYAGDAVLSAFYRIELCDPGEVEVFVPVRHRKNHQYLEQQLLAMVHCALGTRVVEGMTPYGRYGANSIKFAPPKGGLVTVVFAPVRCDPVRITRGQFRSILGLSISFTLGSIAWDGERLYYPDMTKQDIASRRSLVRGQGPENRAKYRKHGFTFGDEED